MRCRELDIFKILGFFSDIVWKIFGKFLEVFLEVFLEFFCRIFFGGGGIVLELFFGRNFLGGFLEGFF